MFSFNIDLPICIGVNVPVIAYFPKFSGRPSLEIRTSLEKNYIFGILVEREVDFVNFVSFDHF